MAKVILSSFVKSYFVQGYQTFITEFSDFATGYDSYYFGRSAKNANSEYIYHVHYVPDSNDPKLKQWDINYKYKKPPFNRTSDNLIFYSINQKHEYLIISFVGPGGHTIFTDRNALAKLENVGRSFVTRGLVP